MGTERCNVCDKLISSLGEEGCEDCGLEYDPHQPDYDQELDFSAEGTDAYAVTPDLSETSDWSDDN